MDRFESMTVFVSVVEAGSLSASSRKLGVPLPTVSRKISELEAHLGVRLLNRSTRRLDLTDAGLVYFSASKRILEELGEAERLAAGEYTTPKGDLVVTAPIVFGRLHMLPLVAEFLKAYPEINIQLVFTDRVVDMLEDHIDLALRIGEL
ncbi:MAG TPA: LysR family transcriptional regulator, partial [Oligoflexus sp.]|uniref:LysR family transcriptional regulator n=1 Tax=Oligoflexus sp. TaxID=1971216 RepID=UPI002D805214